MAKKHQIKWRNPVNDKDIYVNWDGVFDPGEYLEGLIQTNLDQRALNDIDEREIPRAANFVEFCYGKNFLNLPPLPRVTQIATTMLGEYCVFCSDRETISNLYNQSIDEIYERVVFTRYGKCPKCQKTRIDFVRNKKWWVPDRLVAVVGQRAGKNFLLTQLALYQLHRFLTFERNNRRIPAYEYFSLAPGPLRMTFTAVTLGQVMDTVWGPFIGVFENAPWFQEYGKFLTHHGKTKGLELYVKNNTFLIYKNKMIDIACRAPDQRKLRGSTRFLYGVDEICWFDAKAESAKGDQKILGSINDIDHALSNSLKTVRNAALKMFKAGDYDAPTGYSLHVSSPCHANDIGMLQLREARTNVFISAWNYPTWEFNPEYPSQDSFRADYLRDPVEAERNFGALPPLTIAPWLTDARPVILSSRLRQDNLLLTYTKKTEVNPFGETTSWFKLDTVKDSTTPRILAIDNGLSNNAFALVVLSIRKGMPCVDECFMLKPSEADSVKVNLDKMFTDFVYPLACKMNVVCGVYDQWNSDQNVQKLRNEGKDWRKYSMKPVDFDFLRGKLQASEVSLPFSEFDLNVFLKSESAELDLVRMSLLKPNFALFLQLLSVRQVGLRLRKPLYGDDDVFRAAALGIKHLYDEELRKRLDYGYKGDISNNSANIDTTHGVVAYRNRSSGSGSQSSSTSGSTSSDCAVVRTKSRR